MHHLRTHRPRLASIYAPCGGVRTVRLPQKSRVTDLLENKPVADAVKEFPLTLSTNGAVLLRLEPSENK